MPIRIDLIKDGANVGNILVDKYVELGRRDKYDVGEVVPFFIQSGDVARWVIADTGGANKVPRKVCGVEPIDGNRIRVSNIHSTNRELWIQKGEKKTQILPGESIEHALPSQIRLPEGLSVEVAQIEIKEIEAENASAHPEFDDQLKSILGGTGTSLSFSSGSSFLSQSTTGGSHSVFSHEPESGENGRLLIQAMRHVIPALQEPIYSPKYLAGIAEAVIKVMDMDRVEIITRKDGKWIYNEENQFLRSRSIEPELPSRSLLERVLSSGKLSTFPDEADEGPSESLMEMQSAIASPLLDPTDDKGGLLGVLYADRRCKMGSGRSASITKDEQEFIAILSVATANRLGNVKKEQELHTYQQFFSQKVITSLLDKGDAFLDGKDTEVSVLFCDIRGFSKATDTMEANAAMQWLSDTLSELSQVVLDADGVLVDYVGDELFAMWGAPDEDPSHGYSAIRAAIKMMEIKRMLNERYKGKIRFKIDFGIGLNTGMARVGNTGSRQKFKYGPMGRTVNLGSRIQGLTKQWQVSTLMAESTAAFVPPDTPKRRLCQAKVVGLDGHVSLYQLMSQQEANDDLIARYAEGLALFESGQQFRQAAKLFGELVQKHPDDGPSLIMLDRSVNQLVHPKAEFSPVWEAFTK